MPLLDDAGARVAEPLYISHQQGHVGGAHGLGEVPLLVHDVHDEAHPADLRDVVSGARADPTRFDWYQPTLRSDDLYLADDIVVGLWYRAHVDLTERDVAVHLDDVGPDGAATRLATATEEVPPAAMAPYLVRYTLETAGETLPEGHVLRLRIQTPSLLGVTWLKVGDAAHPSGILKLPARLLDTDHDGLGDSAERRLGTDPTEPDSDSDGVLDGVEVRRGTDPLQHTPRGSFADAHDGDSDGLLDREEAQHKTDPADPDTDGDDVPDGLEVRHATDPLDPTSAPADRDQDGIPDGDERAAGTDPRLWDSDRDGISDCRADPDADGLDNCTEAAFGTNPRSADTDGDGADDATESARGSDPLVPDPLQVQAQGGDPDEMRWGAWFFLVCLALTVLGLVRPGRPSEVG